MTTLDDVIEAMERCSIPHYFDCHGCPYEDDDAEVGCRSDDRDADVLYYLRELAHYLAELDNPDGEHQQLIKCQALLHDFYRNDPLTWDELRQMEGKPVWVEGDHGCIWGQKAWSLIRLDPENDDIVICINTDNGVHYEFAIGQEDYGIDWQAYRKELS